MIINTGQRTDIPAFYAKWFSNRIKEGHVCVRNPFNPKQVSRYRLDPKVVDLISFCTKNPEPMFEYMDLIKGFGQLWYVTITPYGKNVEPNVKDKHQILEDFKQLSNIVGRNCIIWRYDPILITDKYTIDYHLHAFKQMAEILDGYTDTVVISFVDLYAKVKRNFPELKEVDKTQRINLGKQIIEIASKHNIKTKTCAEGDELSIYGADCNGCMTISDYEKALNKKLIVKNYKGSRKECACYISCDIGAYNTCKHLCRYCYANENKKLVLDNYSKHDPDSPFLIGNYQKDDIINDVIQKSWIDNQISLL